LFNGSHHSTFNSKLRNVIREDTRILYVYVCFCIPLLCYLPTEIGLYCKCQYFVPFISATTNCSGRDVASVKHLAHMCSTEKNKFQFTNNFRITSPLRLELQSSEWRADVAAIHLNGTHPMRFCILKRFCIL